MVSPYHAHVMLALANQIDDLSRPMSPRVNHVVWVGYVDAMEL